MSDTPRTDSIAHKGYTERTYICEMTELARILETELATMTARAEKAEDETLVWRNRFASILWSGALGKSTVRDFKKWEAEYKAEQNALTARAEKAEAALSAEREKVRVLRDSMTRLEGYCSWVITPTDRICAIARAALFVTKEGSK